jgi:hypothetical protein
MSDSCNHDGPCETPFSHEISARIDATNEWDATEDRDDQTPVEPLTGLTVAECAILRAGVRNGVASVLESAVPLLAIGKLMGADVDDKAQATEDVLKVFLDLEDKIKWCVASAKAGQVTVPDYVPDDFGRNAA